MPEVLDDGQCLRGRGARVRACDAASREKIGDIADADDGKSGFGERIQNRARGRHCKIAALGGALEGAWLATKGAGDDPADATLVRMPAGDATSFVELRQGEHGLVGGDLEDGVL